MKSFWQINIAAKILECCILDLFMCNNIQTFLTPEKPQTNLINFEAETISAKILAFQVRWIITETLPSLWGLIHFLILNTKTSGQSGGVSLSGVRQSGPLIEIYGSVKWASVFLWHSHTISHLLTEFSIQIAIITQGLPKVMTKPITLLKVGCYIFFEKWAMQVNIFFHQLSDFFKKKIHWLVKSLQSRIDVYAAHYPDRTSVKTVLHWKQV